MDDLQEVTYNGPTEDDNKGRTSGKLVISGFEDEEELAAIMAAVSRDINIPLIQLKFKSIKRI